MRRILLVLAVAAMMAAMLVVMATPAFAAKGSGGCGPDRCGGGGSTTVDVPAGPHKGIHEVLGDGGRFLGEGGGCGQGVGGTSCQGS